MGFLDFFRTSPSLHIADCLARTTSVASSFPASLSGKSSDGATRPLCRIEKDGRTYKITPLDQESLPLLNGEPLTKPAEIDLDHSYGLALSGFILEIRLSRSKSALDNSFQEGNWKIRSRKSSETVHLHNDEISRAAISNRFQPLSEFEALPIGATVSFPLHTLWNLTTTEPQRLDTTEGDDSTADYGSEAIGDTPGEGEHVCPTCWKTFKVARTLNIAAHDELIGDPILGPEARLRFAATRFNERGQALDPKGVLSTDLACPHCRGRLPPSFFRQDQLILSLVGAPSSGKSYYLATLLKVLPERLLHHNKMVLQDADPSGNVRLNEMKNRLFSATTPEDAFISKTDFEGLMYDHLPRNGKQVALPRPFVYQLRQIENPDQRAALVLYDNAGEHFKPTISLNDSPGALHVSASSALFFLYDPAANASFRRALRRKRDPQLRSQGTDEQDTILAEMAARVKKIRGIDSHELVDTPLAVMAGKYDLWKNLLPENAIHLPEDRPLSDEEIEENSALTRSLLMEHCPTIVANAETLSSQVRYFPISPLGHSPKEISEGPLAGKLAPNPRRLNPILADEPALWALRIIASDTFPKFES